MHKTQHMDPVTCRFSVIIPTLNEEVFLPRLLASLVPALKPYKELSEVIIVDGNSDDATLQEAARFQNDVQLICITAHERNVSFQRNTGATLSKGEYLVFIDADGLVPPNFFTLIERYIDMHPDTHVIIPHIYFRKSKAVAKLWNAFTKWSGSLNHPLSRGGNVILERTAFFTLGGFDTSLKIAEDHHLVQKAKQHTKTIHYAKDIHMEGSERRLEKEGYMKLAVKFGIATGLALLGFYFKKHLFRYDMGGARYTEKK